MLQELEKVRSYSAVRARLRNPPNAVADLGIDLNRKVEPPAVPPQVVVQSMPLWRGAMLTYRGFPIFADEQASTVGDGNIIAVPKIRDIQGAVARHYGVSVRDMLSRRRRMGDVRPRQVAMYFAKEMTPRSLPEIGRQFGGKDHTTVLHAVRKIKYLVETEPETRDEIELIELKIRGRA